MAAGVAVSIGVEDGLGVGLAEGLAVLVGVGVAVGATESSDPIGHPHPIVVVIARSAIPRSVAVLLFKSLVLISSLLGRPLLATSSSRHWRNLHSL